VLLKTVPEMIQGLINGTALGMNTGLAGAAASLAGSATALGMAVNAARDLAREQMTDAQAANPASSGPGMTQRTLGNIATAAAGNIGDRLSGRAVHGNRFGQIAGELGRRAEHLRGERHKQEKEAARTSGSPASTPSSSPGTKPDEPPVPPQSGPAVLNPGRPPMTTPRPSRTSGKRSRPMTLLEKPPVPAAAPEAIRQWGLAFKDGYFAARQEWLERYGDHIAAARAWRRVAQMALAVAALALGGLIWVSLQGQIVPYVVRIDRGGGVAGVKRADRMEPPDKGGGALRQTGHPRQQCSHRGAGQDSRRS
jgi:hypothetical protein